MIPRMTHESTPIKFISNVLLNSSIVITCITAIIINISYVVNTIIKIIIVTTVLYFYYC